MRVTGTKTAIWSLLAAGVGLLSPLAFAQLADESPPPAQMNFETFVTLKPGISLAKIRSAPPPDSGVIGFVEGRELADGGVASIDWRVQFDVAPSADAGCNVFLPGYRDYAARFWGPPSGTPREWTRKSEHLQLRDTCWLWDAGSKQDPDRTICCVEITGRSGRREIFASDVRFDHSALPLEPPTLPNGVPDRKE